MQASERMIDGPRRTFSPPTEDRGFQDDRCTASSKVKIRHRLLGALSHFNPTFMDLSKSKKHEYFDTSLFSGEEFDRNGNRIYHLVTLDFSPGKR
jgi:hypothetical protein